MGSKAVPDDVEVLRLRLVLLHQDPDQVRHLETDQARVCRRLAARSLLSFSAKVCKCSFILLFTCREEDFHLPSQLQLHCSPRHPKEHLSCPEKVSGLENDKNQL